MGNRQETIDTFWALKAENRLSASVIGEICNSLPALITEPELCRDAVAVLCEIAARPEEEFRIMGQRAIFASIAEPLGDSFEPANVPLYDRVFAQIIDDSRRRPGGERLDQTLARFNIHNEQDLLLRKAVIGSLPLSRPAREAVKKVFVISRVTLGADVVVSSVMIQAAEAAFPKAFITFIAPQGTRQLFSDTPRFRTLPLTYPRHGSLLDRFDSWVQLVQTLDEERANLSAGECVVVDPDSRLTQLGLLPLTDDETEHLFFDSRSFRKPGFERLGQLAAQWCREILGAEQEPYPFVRLAAEKQALGRSCSAVLRTRGRNRIVSFNFGFGANEAKQLGSDFEVQVILQALDRGCSVVLDKGIGRERDRANLVIARLKADGKKVAELKAYEAKPDLPLDVDAIAWEGDAAGFAGLIASTDLYIGYDSAFQHIAAALGVSVIDIFAHTDNNRFVERWTPHSRAPVRALKITAGDSAGALREIDDSIRELNRP
jgi:ADP-heptose:LPS heptosyltransferase